MRIDRQDLYALLRARNIPYEETAHPAVWSMEELHALCLPGEERILKNLFLRDDKRRQIRCSCRCWLCGRVCR